MYLELSRSMEVKLQDQGQIDQDLEQRLSPRGSQPNHGFLSKQEKHESTQIKGQASQGATIISQTIEVEISIMLLIKWSEKVEVLGDNIDAPMCN